MATFIIKIKNGDLDFKSDYNGARFRDWAKKNEGKLVKLEPVAAKVSENFRKYYFGAVIPFIQKLVPEWSGIDADDVHEILKKNFNGFVAFNPFTKRNERFSKSAFSTESTGKRAALYLLRLATWVEEEYGEMLPDPEEYKRIIGDAALTHEEYEKIKKNG